jgi:MTH538 TIR-like domain (DUF1863)
MSNSLYRPGISDLLAALGASSPLAPSSPFALSDPFAPSNPFSSLSPSLPTTPLTPSVSDLLRAYLPPAPPLLPIAPTVNALTAPEVKRKVYFAFDFDDLIRVNNVRQIGKIAPREQKNLRTFSDRSIWESRNIKNEENLKNLMRQGVRYSSAVCVLVGANTWRSRWAKYEIARAVIDERGLLAVHINSINHHVRKTPDRYGINPLHMMGVFHAANGNYYLYEKHVVVTNATAAELGFEWRQYEDFADPVPLPRYMPDVAAGYVMPLSVHAHEYDMARDDGFNNIGAWIDAAATQVGR